MGDTSHEVCGSIRGEKADANSFCFDGEVETGGDETGCSVEIDGGGRLEDFLGPFVERSSKLFGEAWVDVSRPVVSLMLKTAEEDDK